MLFIQFYIGVGDEREAARQAGFKNPGVDGHRLLTNPEVVSAIVRGQVAFIEEYGRQKAIVATKDIHYIDHHLRKLIEDSDDPRVVIRGLRLAYESFGMLGGS